MGIMTFLHEQFACFRLLARSRRFRIGTKCGMTARRTCTQAGAASTFVSIPSHRTVLQVGKARQASYNASSPVGALAEGGEGLDSTPSAACSAASLPARPARVAIVHISTMRDRLTPLGDAAATAPAQPAQRKFQSHDSCGCDTDAQQSDAIGRRIRDPAQPAQRDAEFAT